MAAGVGAGRGLRNRADEGSIKKSLTTGRHASVRVLMAWEGSMSFQVVRQEHPYIFVVNIQTYETYRFTVGDDVALASVGPPSDLGKARRTAFEFLAQRENAVPSGQYHTINTKQD